MKKKINFMYVFFKEFYKGIDRIVSTAIEFFLTLFLADIFLKCIFGRKLKKKKKDNN